MLKTWLAAVCCTVLSLAARNGALLVAADEWDAEVDAIINAYNLSANDLIGQMTQIATYSFLDANYELDNDTVRGFARENVGSYLGAPMGDFGEVNGSWGWTVAQERQMVASIQEIAMEENNGMPMLFGVDSTHGAAMMLDAVFFPQQLNGAASFNPDLVYEQGRITGRDTLAMGIPWIFGPILGVSTNPLWPRTYETFGEDPYVVSVLGDALIRGLQSNNGLAACMKHWIAYSATPTGHDKDGTSVSDFDLLNTYLPSFKAAVDAGVLSAMEAYSSLNGVPVVESHKVLTQLLRDDLGFDNMVVSDFAEINQLQTFHRVAHSTAEATKMALERASVDLSMVGMDFSFTNGTKELLAQEPEMIARITESARRVLKLKLKLGVFDNPLPGEEYLELVGNDDDVAASLELARESIVLLQNNDSVLPLAANASVFLTGSSADNIGYQCGGSTLQVIGVSGNDMFMYGSSVKQAFGSMAGNDSVNYFNGLYANGSYSDADLETAKEMASQAEYTIAVIGEAPYEEKTGDIDDLALPAGQIEYVNALASTGTKVILVLIEGRPRLLGDLPENVHAVVNALLPCELGGQAIAEVIYGDVNPSGRMPITYPKDAGNVMIPYRHRVSTLCADSENCEMQWDFGAGLSYTTFDYSELTLSTANVTSSSDCVEATVTVTNSGSVAGKETVMLFLTQPFRSLSVPEVKQLKKFSKISLEAGESQTVSFTLTADDWSVYYPQIGKGLKKVAEDSDFVVAIKPETDCDVYNSTAVANPLCATFTLQTGEYPFGSLVAE